MGFQQHGEPGRRKKTNDYLSVHWKPCSFLYSPPFLFAIPSNSHRSIGRTKDIQPRIALMPTWYDHFPLWPRAAFEERESLLITGLVLGVYFPSHSEDPSSPLPLVFIQHAACASILRSDPSNFCSFHVGNPESIHQLVNLFSDRGTPESLRKMDAFSGHTYKFTKEVSHACAVYA